VRGTPGRKKALSVVCATASLALAGLARADSTNVRLHGAPGMAVRQAIEGASLRLERPGCQQVLSDFSDGAGRPLQAALDELGETPASYLRRLVFFYDGASQRRCASGEVLGGTQPGSRVIYVCPRQFFEAYRRDTLLAEVFVIHETLHSLGLGENPPASLEITQRVMTRCSERAALD
jgi:hypothetical protein